MRGQPQVGLRCFIWTTCINEFSTGSSGPGPPPLLRREETAILSVPQGLVEAQASRRFQNDGGTDQAGRPHRQSAPTGDEAVRKAEMGRSEERRVGKGSGVRGG